MKPLYIFPTGVKFGLLLIVSFFVVKCSLFEEETELQLKVLEASCTEVWLKVENADAKKLDLFRDDSLVQTINLKHSDTTLIDSGLLPSRNYSYKLKNSGQNTRARATTMDTTSNNFTWQTWTFGEHSSSVLNDVAIIDENNIWAVGEIYVNDSIGRYNAVHWDGQKWELKQILYKGGFWDINTIFAFGSNDIWFEAYMKWDGEKFISLEIPQIMTGFSINKIWGTSSKDLYVVGNNGQLRHYDGKYWVKIESNTDLNINDIWGDYNRFEKRDEILCVASNIGSSPDRTCFRITDKQVEQLPTDGIEGSLSGTWFKAGKKYYLAGGGIYENFNPNNTWKNDPLDITQFYTTKIRGTGLNDIYAVGAFGEVVHFNGESWNSQQNDTYISGSYTALALLNEQVVIVGGVNSQAVITVGQHLK